MTDEALEEALALKVAKLTYSRRFNLENYEHEQMDIELHFDPNNPQQVEELGLVLDTVQKTFVRASVPYKRIVQAKQARERAKLEAEKKQQLLNNARSTDGK